METQLRRSGTWCFRHSPKHFVPPGPHVPNELLDLHLGDEVAPEYPGEDLHRGLELLGDYVIGSGLMERFHLLHISGPHQYEKSRVHPLGHLGDSTGASRVGDGCDQDPGLLHPGVAEDCGMSGIAKRDDLPFLPLLSHRVRVGFQNQVRDSRHMGRAGEVTTIDAEPHDDEVVR